eukprot:763658-Hanusia_phi.AAC.3
MTISLQSSAGLHGGQDWSQILPPPCGSDAGDNELLALLARKEDDANPNLGSWFGAADQMPARLTLMPSRLGPSAT